MFVFERMKNCFFSQRHFREPPAGVVVVGGGAFEIGEKKKKRFQIKKVDLSLRVTKGGIESFGLARVSSKQKANKTAAKPEN